MALFALQFSKIFRGSMPPDPPREVPPSAVALSVPEKNPTFSQNLIGSTDKLEEFKLENHDSLSNTKI